MLKKVVKYTDYNGVEREEPFYFNLTKAEITEMEYGTTGTLSAMVENMITAKDTPSLIKMFKKLLFMSYGEKSPDGRRFIKSKEISEAFSHTEAYSIIFMELATNDKAAAEFINGIIPADIASEVAKDPRMLELVKG